MAKQTNMQILKALLNDEKLQTWTTFEEEEINNLPPLNHYTTGNEPQRFLYDDYDSLIALCEKGYDPKQYHKFLFRLPGIEFYEADLAVIPDEPQTSL